MNRVSVTVLLIVVGVSSLFAESRHALVIGNNAYKHARALVNPKNDAQAMSAKLKTVGFTVIEREDASLKDMKSALREFVQSVPEGGVALVYYAGHGVQLKGTNYLVPVDATMAEEFEVPDETLSMDAVLRGLETTKSALNIIVLDSCRDDPFSRSWRGSRSLGGNGLNMPADMPQGMFIAFATSPGKTAEDGDGGHSPYAAALIEELGQPGLDFEKVFKNVGARVVKVTSGKQEPWFNSKFYGSFSFAAGTASNLPAQTSLAASMVVPSTPVAPAARVTPDLPKATPQLATKPMNTGVRFSGGSLAATRWGMLDSDGATHEFEFSSSTSAQYHTGDLTNDCEYSWSGGEVSITINGGYARLTGRLANGHLEGAGKSNNRSWTWQAYLK